MGHKIFLYGESGTGKTSSIRNLPPAETGIINIDRKALPLAGWRHNYKTVKGVDGIPDPAQSNYAEPKSVNGVLTMLDGWDKRDDIKYIVIDTLTHLITNDYIRTALGAKDSFKGWQMLGKNTYNILDTVRDLKANVLVIGHSEVEYNDMGQRIVKMKTQGKMIDNMVPPSFFTTVLVPEIQRDKDQVKYMFRTQSDGMDAAKSPVIFEGDSFREALPLLVPNDIKMVFDLLEEFENLNAQPVEN